MIKNLILALITDDIKQSDQFLELARNKFIETFIGGNENEL